MCNATALAAQAILNALSKAIKSGRIFTAFDITTDARRETDEHIAHADSREIVHNEYVIGEFPDEYNRQEQLELDNGQIAICYYPDGKVAEDHPKAARHTATTSPVTSPVAALNTSALNTPAPTATNTKTGGKTKDGNSFICNVTSEGRLNVPRELFSRIVAEGGTFDVQFEGSIIYKTPIGKEKRLVLKKSDLKGGVKFKVGVDVSKNTITVEKI